ncbi:MAG: KAP family NTPase [Magnetococcus sp. YQC-3]
MNDESVVPLHIRPEEHDPDSPFAGDQFNRKRLADRLTSMIERMSVGCVLAIDAPWGEGKTWFGKNWLADLRSRDFSVVFIDAFKQDYVDDPFLMVCAEILAGFKGDEQARNRFAEAGIRVARMLLPIAVRSAVRVAERSIFASVDLAEEYRKIVEETDKGMADAIEKQLAKRLVDHANDKRSVEGFTDLLKEHAASLDKPLVVIVDELDRCRPDFAVRTVERIKHFFDVPGVVFVLLVNRLQLEASIRGVYGGDLDARAYLGKFIQLWLRLPKIRNQESSFQDHNLIYCKELARRFGLDQSPEHNDFRDMFALLASWRGLSLRDLERGYTLYALAQPTGRESAFFGWAVYLKLVLPEVHAGILSGVTAAHKSAMEELARVIETTKDNGFFSACHDLHRFLVDKGSSSLSERTQELLQAFGYIGGVNPDTFLPWLCGRIDLNVEI